jgi:hypothetical protein
MQRNVIDEIPNKEIELLSGGATNHVTEVKKHEDRARMIQKLLLDSFRDFPDELGFVESRDLDLVNCPKSSPDPRSIHGVQISVTTENSQGLARVECSSSVIIILSVIMSLRFAEK